MTEVTNINWHYLRALNNSQNAAFEEICCQLAECEQVPKGSKFIRKGAPDAGVECYWQLPNSEEWGWQAKFFLAPPTSRQWAQLDESVKTALIKHPQLTLYTVCLPIDRMDPRIENKSSFMHEWDAHVIKWQKLAKRQNKTVDYVYWGAHELWVRLSAEQQKGRFFFWFHEQFFSQKWFEESVEEAIANAGQKYSPQINVQLPISEVFDGLGRMQAFYARWRDLYDKIKRTCSRAMPRNAEGSTQGKLIRLEENITKLTDYLSDLDSSRTEPLKLDAISVLAANSRDLAWDCLACLRKGADNIARTSQDDASIEVYQQFGGYNSERHFMAELARQLSYLVEMANGDAARLANQPALLITGEAGTGKTHLLCDIAQARVKSGLPTLLLHGMHFRNEEPWHQIAEILGLDVSKEELLGALQAAAQVSRSRCLILIDALNEGDGKWLWQKYLSGILTILARYPDIGIAISVRKSYEDWIVPENLVPQRLLRVEHTGFAERTFDAIQTFFAYFNIQSPSIPILNPEFYNPLFLKLFCQALKNSGLTTIPQGFQGISWILKSFVDSVNKKLSSILNFDPKSKLVWQSVEILTELMAISGKTWLPRIAAQEVVNSLLPHTGYETSLFLHLVSGGIIAEDIFETYENEEFINHEGVYFAYERFTDHLVAAFLLSKYLDPRHPTSSFQPGQPMHKLIQDEEHCRQNYGLIEATTFALFQRNMEVG
jgi:hypothetical protein